MKGEPNGFSCAILAGGEGSRLRAEKSLLTIGNHFLAEILITNLRPIFDDIMLVVKSEHSPLRALSGSGVRLVADMLPCKGPLAGIHSALHHSSSRFCFVIACDMPFPALPLVERIMQLVDDHEAVVPRCGDYIEPLFAVYARSLEEETRVFLEKGNNKIHDFLDGVNAFYVERKEVESLDPQGLSFFNINTPEDLARARYIYLGSGHSGSGH